MNFKSVKAFLAKSKITLRRTAEGEYRVNYCNGTEMTAYYTDFLDDALRSGVEMAASEKRRGRRKSVLRILVTVSALAQTLLVPVAVPLV